MFAPQTLVTTICNAKAEDTHFILMIETFNCMIEKPVWDTGVKDHRLQILHKY